MSEFQQAAATAQRGLGITMEGPLGSIGMSQNTIAAELVNKSALTGTDK